MVRNIKKAPLPLYDDNHHPRLRVSVVKLRLPLARGARLGGFFAQHFCIRVTVCSTKRP